MREPSNKEMVAAIAELCDAADAFHGARPDFAMPTGDPAWDRWSEAFRTVRDLRDRAMSATRRTL